MTKNSRPRRVGVNFEKELEDVQLRRIMNKMDKPTRPLTMPEFTNMIPRHSDWPKIKEGFLKLDRKEIRRKSGFFAMFRVISILTIIAILALVVVVIASVWTYGFNEITTAVQNVDSTASSNISYYGGTVVFGNLNIGFQQFKWISYMLIFGLMLGAFIGMFLIREHPGFFALYVLMVIIFVAFSIFLSNAYESLYTAPGILGTELQSYGGSSWLLLNLPTWMTVIAFVGAVLMFVVWNRDQAQGGLG